jgi:hypothetical protein
MTVAPGFRKPGRRRVGRVAFARAEIENKSPFAVSRQGPFWL